MPLSETLRRAANGLDTVIDVLEQIAKMTRNTTDDRAVEVLRAIEEAVHVILDGLDGRIDEHEMRLAVAELAKNDAAADQALRDKFPNG